MGNPYILHTTLSALIVAQVNALGSNMYFYVNIIFHAQSKRFKICLRILIGILCDLCRGHLRDYSAQLQLTSGSRENFIQNFLSGYYVLFPQTVNQPLNGKKAGCYSVMKLC